MENALGKMTILSHINELRKRLLVAVVALAVTTLASFAFSQTLAELLAKPIGGLSAMASIEVTENVTAFMKISLLSGVVLSMPVIVFEILAFVLPGLNNNERKWIWFVIPVATLFFAGGVAFAYLVMLPAALPFLLDFMGITTIPRPNDYFSFVLNLLFWVGISFEMPLLMLVLSRLGIVKPKALIKQWRIALIASAVLSALITPTPDPVNMGLMMIPLVGLYFIGILFSIIGQKKTNDGKEKKPKPQKKSKSKRVK
ncbi:MAG: twin-arginine translocase subunit TatC [Anaerolineaceae bacterium]|nr:twin-arginine translocase subunit TatC [Anaerolineaceae bacterium]